MELNKDQIRALLLDPEAQDAIAELMPSYGDREILGLVKIHKFLSPRLLSDLKNLSVMSASVRLCRLYHKGYLMRSEVAQESGGYEWRYTLNPALHAPGASLDKAEIEAQAIEQFGETLAERVVMISGIMGLEYYRAAIRHVYLFTKSRAEEIRRAAKEGGNT